MGDTGNNYPLGVVPALSYKAFQSQGWNPRVKAFQGVRCGHGSNGADKPGGYYFWEEEGEGHRDSLVGRGMLVQQPNLLGRHCRFLAITLLESL